MSQSESDDPVYQSEAHSAKIQIQIRIGWVIFWQKVGNILIEIVHEILLVPAL